MKSKVGPIFALFIIALLSISTVAAIPGNAKKSDSRGNQGIGSPDTECRALGFDYGIAKWEAQGNGFSPEGDAQGTYVSGTPSEFDWSFGSSGADGIVIKAGRLHYVADIDGTSGTIEQDRPETSHVTFCGNYGDEQETLTCQEALDADLISAMIVNGVATVQNDADQPIDMNLAVYEMYSENIEDQLLYDSESHIATPGVSEVSVNVPRDAYQVDLVCGPVLKWNPEYYDRVIAFEFGNKGDWAIPTPTVDVVVTLEIEDSYPQGNKYSFHCVAPFDADSYHWYYGDGENHIGSTQDKKFYTYQEPGDYTVACIAVSDTNWGADTLDITVEFD